MITKRYALLALLTSFCALNIYSSPFSYNPQIVYHKNYDISFFGLEKILHYFDTHKYSKTFNYLTKNNLISKSAIHTPTIITDEQLLAVHKSPYLESLKNSHVIAQVAGVPLFRIMPNFLLRKKILEPMKYATAGTILAAELAMQHGLAFNLSGGYHHAKANQGEGFCFFADIPLAINKLWKNHPELKIVIIDLDAHQGNGNSTILRNDPRVTLIDAYGKYNYPTFHDYLTQFDVQYRIPLEWRTEDAEYLEKVKTAVDQAIVNHKPQLIIYNAGTDILIGDPLGGMSITAQGVIMRDQLVIESAIKNNIPIVMTLSGGYTKQSAEVISKSLENIIKNVCPKLD
jgi:histone deacetylase 11